MDVLLQAGALTMILGAGMYFLGLAWILIRAITA